MRAIVFILLLGGPAGLLPAQQDEPLSEKEKGLHALSRLAFGHGPGDLEEVRQRGLGTWIEAQLHPARLDESGLEERLSRYETLGLTPQALWDLVQRPLPEDASPEERRQRRRERRQGSRELLWAVIERSVFAERQLFEVLSDFWRNHFNVDLSKGNLYYTAPHYEHAVIREHVFGRFGDMLSASAHHPAMLVYLDNALSRRPPPKAELRRIERRVRRRTGSRDLAEQQVRLAEQRGLNENYARELMELHTLGVDNGYTQRDVVEVARAFTGWSIQRSEEEPTWFSYKEGMHDPGRKHFLGRQLPRGRRESGIVEGETILRILASHPNTSEFIATKLVRRLVNDDPPGDIVGAAAKAFRKHEGDLREVVRAIVTHPDFFAREHYRAKFKTPLEFLVSALRATGAEVTGPEHLVRTLRELHMPLYRCEDPTGYSDTAESWRDPGVMALRWRFAMRLARGDHPGARIPDSFYEGLPEDPIEMIDVLAGRIVPQGLSGATRAVLERALFRSIQRGMRGGPDLARLARTLTGICLGCPEFQQQ